MIGSHDAPTLIPLAWRQPPHCDHGSVASPGQPQVDPCSCLQSYWRRSSCFLTPVHLSPNYGLGFRSFDELLQEPIGARTRRSYCRHGGTDYKDATCGATGWTTPASSSAYLLLPIRRCVALTMNKESEQPAHVEGVMAEVRDSARHTFQC